MFKWLFLIFVLVPCIELALLVTVGRAVGLTATLGIILLTGFVGAWLARRQGAGALIRIQSSLSEGRMPGDELIDGALIFAAGLLLVTPGLLTDAVGFALLIPPLRRWMRRVVGAAVKRHFRNRVVVHHEMHWGAGPTMPDESREEEPKGGHDVVIDVKAESVEHEDP